MFRIFYTLILGAVTLMSRMTEVFQVLLIVPYNTIGTSTKLTENKYYFDPELHDLCCDVRK